MASKPTNFVENAPWITQSPTCHAINFQSGVLQPGLEVILNGIVQSLNAGKFEEVEALFHPRLRKKKKIISALKSRLQVKYTKPWNFSVYRVWLLHSPEGNKKVLNCPDSDGLQITNLYGYDFQLGFMVQKMAANELGRIYFSLVPVKSKWHVGGLHLQQWTQQGRNYLHWWQHGKKELGNKKVLRGYMSLDIAQKLLFGGDFLQYQDKPAILKLRDQQFSKKEFLQEIRDHLEAPNIAYVGTLLGNDGIGLLIREVVLAEYSAQQFRALCLKRGLRLKKSLLASDFSGGLQCSYLFPSEAVDREGKLGGFYLPPKDMQ